MCGDADGDVGDDVGPSVLLSNGWAGTAMFAGSGVYRCAQGTVVLPSNGCGCTGGGKFWAVKGAKVTENWVHDNRSVGLWADTNNVDFLFQRNIVENNDDVGIWYEISYNARISDNLIARNGWEGGRSDTGTPINKLDVISCCNVLLYLHDKAIQRVEDHFFDS